MMEFLAWVEHLEFSQWVISSPSIWAYATILTAHTTGMMIVAGICAIINLRLLGMSPSTPIKPLERLYPLMWAGFWLNLATGTALLMADATTKFRNWDFGVKMVFVIAGVMVVKRIRKRVFAAPELDNGPLPAGAKGLAWASMICWVGAITAGRLLAYVGPVSGVPGLKN